MRLCSLLSLRGGAGRGLYPLLQGSIKPVAWGFRGSIEEVWRTSLVMLRLSFLISPSGWLYQNLFRARGLWRCLPSAGVAQAE